MTAKIKNKSLFLVHIEHLCEISKLVRFASYSEQDDLVKLTWDAEGGEHYFLGNPEETYKFINGVLVGRQIYTNHKKHL